MRTGGGMGGGGNVVTGLQYSQSGAGSKMPSLNNNLSELDTLLQDLSNARYNSHASDKGNFIQFSQFIVEDNFTFQFINHLFLFILEAFILTKCNTKLQILNYR